MTLKLKQNKEAFVQNWQMRVGQGNKEIEIGYKARECGYSFRAQNSWKCHWLLILVSNRVKSGPSWNSVKLKEPAATSVRNNERTTDRPHIYILCIWVKVIAFMISRSITMSVRRSLVNNGSAQQVQFIRNDVCEARCVAGSSHFQFGNLSWLMWLWAAVSEIQVQELLDNRQGCTPHCHRYLPH